MVRGKVQLKRVENPVHRQVTFCKRRSGLLKKAMELSVLCDADIGIIIFSPHGKLYELATKGTMENLIERYKTAGGEAQTASNDVNRSQEAEQEISVLKQENDLLHKGLRYMFGGGTSECMTLAELLTLERHLEDWMYHIRAAKMQIMFQEIQSLKNKEGILKATNELLKEKIVEQSAHFNFNMSPVMVQQNGYYDVAPVTANNYPLTLQNEYSDLGGSMMGFSC